MHCTAAKWTFGCRRSLQEIGAGVAFRRCPEDYWSIETGVYDISHFGFCWLHQTILFRDWCDQGWNGDSAVTEASRWMIPPIAYGSRALTPHKKNYHLTKLEILALKWVVTEHFKEYLPYQSFLVKTDNNPLTYIMMTPYLDATSYWWVGALVWFNFELEY